MELTGKPEIPVRTGYDFLQWCTVDGKPLDENAVVDDETYFATWNPRTDTPYTVNHYRMEKDGSYTLDDSEVLYGTTDELVVPSCRIYTENDSPTEKELRILADGSAVLDYYYPLKRTGNWDMTIDFQMYFMYGWAAAPYGLYGGGTIPVTLHSEDNNSAPVVTSNLPQTTGIVYGYWDNTWYTVGVNLSSFSLNSLQSVTKPKDFRMVLRGTYSTVWGNGYTPGSAMGTKSYDTVVTCINGVVSFSAAPGCFFYTTEHWSGTSYSTGVRFESLKVISYELL